jgi:hypothetical protein
VSRRLWRISPSLSRHRSSRPTVCFLRIYLLLATLVL